MADEIKSVGRRYLYLSNEAASGLSGLGDHYAAQLPPPLIPVNAVPGNSTPFTDNGDGTYTPNTFTITDNGDGTWSSSGAVIDNGDGTFALAA